MIEGSEKVGNVTYPIANPDRIQKTRQRRETLQRDRSNGKKGKNKKKKSTEDHRLDRRV